MFFYQQSGEDIQDINVKEEEFNGAIRKYTVTFLLLLTLYLTSFMLLIRYRKRTESIERYQSREEDTDALVDRISVWICSFSLAISIGAVSLLPASIISNEVLLHYPKVYYLEWLNASLIQGLWSGIFLFSNLCVFVLLPFAYFFIESSGFSGARRGIWGRVYETVVVLVLIGFLVAGFSWVLNALLGRDDESRRSVLHMWKFYLPFLYSLVSSLGVLMLLIFTPLGFFRLFTVVGNLVMKPQLKSDIEEKLDAGRLEEQTYVRKLQFVKDINNGIQKQSESREFINKELEKIRQQNAELQQKKSLSRWRRTLAYPLLMLLMLALTGIAVLIVTLHCLTLLIDEKALPSVKQHVNIGDASLSAFGTAGAGLQTVLITYFVSASLVGCYTSPGFRRLLPKWQDTSMTAIIGNCFLILVLSSALPLLCRTLGITNFDLLEEFGEIEWLGNFYIVLIYNLSFASCTALILVKKISSPLIHALLDRLGIAAFEMRLKTFKRRLSNGDELLSHEETKLENKSIVSNGKTPNKNKTE